jgi:AcrR family transcriptional regulator
LRERKRVATREAIEKAAVDIAFDRGYEAATAEAIAARAGVSLRTFFNYFGNKDTAIAGTPLRIPDETHGPELLRQSEPQLLKGIVRLFELAAAHHDPPPEVMRRRRELIWRYPPLLQRHHAAIDAFESELAKVVADYLGDNPDRRRLRGKLTIEEEARLAVNMVGSAFRYTARSPGGRDHLDVSERARIIEHTIDLMAKIHEGQR